MNICQKEKCTACSACESVCPKKCISMKDDEFGEPHPVIDEQQCVECNLCRKTCPNNSSLAFFYPQKCYASWITDKTKRYNCASGGIGTALSEYIIEYKKGVVFGTRFDENWTPKTMYASTIEEVNAFKGSKYVQSIIANNTFKQIKEYLISGRYVMYIATPCQIAGLISYLNKDYDKLITVDLICHGVCPPSYFKAELNYLKQTHSFKDLTDIRFRYNGRYTFRLTLWNKKKILYKPNMYSQYYTCGYFMGVTMRENCYSCSYARPERISDITIGDFIGLGKKRSFKHMISNVSSVFINTGKGNDLYKELSEYLGPKIVNVERYYEERLEYGPSLRYPFERHKLNNKFRNLYLEYGYVIAVRKTLKRIVVLDRIKQILNIWTYSYRIPRKLYRIIYAKFLNY